MNSELVAYTHEVRELLKKITSFIISLEKSSNKWSELYTNLYSIRNRRIASVLDTLKPAPGEDPKRFNKHLKYELLIENIFNQELKSALTEANWSNWNELQLKRAKSMFQYIRKYEVPSRQFNST